MPTKKPRGKDRVADIEKFLDRLPCHEHASQRAEVEELKAIAQSHDQKFAELKSCVSDVKAQVDHMVNIQVNGEKGLEPSLRGMYRRIEAMDARIAGKDQVTEMQKQLQEVYDKTVAERSNYDLKQAFRQWRQSHPMMQALFGTKVGIGFVAFILYIIYRVVTHAYPTAVQDVIKFIFP